MNLYGFFFTCLDLEQKISFMDGHHIRFEKIKIAYYILTINLTRFFIPFGPG